MDKKIKVFVLSDMLLSPSGVGTQTKYVCEALLKTGKFTIRAFGGAIKHPNYNPIKTEEWGEDLIIYPVDGYGTPEMVRSLLRQEKPDILWFMTDPRFWGWLWEMENEIRPLVPMVYYHVWDNYPYPTFNKTFYDSNDYIASISKVTDDIVRNVSPDVNCVHIPHAVNSEIFQPTSKNEEFKKKVLGDSYAEDKMVFFWNNRNARRKQSGSLIFWFKKFLDKVGHDKAMLLMHTDVKDPHGQDLKAIVDHLGMDKGQVLFSESKVTPQDLARVYNMADCTINVSDAEGFGLATLESLSCGTPIIVNKTGGLKEQISGVYQGIDVEYGVGIEPASKAIIGSQPIPWIYEDRVSEEDVVAALEKMYNMTEAERQQLGRMGREHVLENYNFKDFEKKWVDFMLEVHEKEGSWDTRRPYKKWELTEL